MEGVHGISRFIASCLNSPNFQARTREDLRDRVNASVWLWAAQLEQLDNEACLAHGDFGKGNLLVRDNGDGWHVAAVLDWEFAISGLPLLDLGRLLRYERIARPILEPHISQGYSRAGAKLPDGWRRVARLADLAALCDSLTQHDLPDEITAEGGTGVCGYRKS